MEKKVYSKNFVVMLVISITCLLISNIITIKTISVGNLIFTVADLLFPITYILNDVFTEVYGFEKAKFVVWISFLCNLLMVIMFYITIKIPGSSEFVYQIELEKVLGTTLRILVASFIAYIVGNISNAVVLSKMKVKTNGKYLALRTIGSTIVGEGLDTLIFIPLVFAGIVSLSTLINMIFTIFMLKVLIETLLTPITYKIINTIKRKEQIDVYDTKTKYNLL